MILDVIAFKNKKLKCWANPTFTQDKLENLETNYHRAIAAGGQVAKEKMKGLTLYHFGKFDDIKGKYELLDEPEFLFDCDDLIASLPEEVSSDVGKN